MAVTSPTKQSTRIQGHICKRLLIHETAYKWIIYRLALLIADMKYHLRLIVQIPLKREQLVVKNLKTLLKARV